MEDWVVIRVLSSSLLGWAFYFYLLKGDQKLSILLFGKNNEYVEDLSVLVSMMHYTRVTTINSVKGLSIEELDYLPTSDSNSIGMLLSHMAALEYYFQVNTFENRELTSEETKIWKNSLYLDEERKNIKGNDLSFYLNTLQDVREKTLNKFKTLNNEWLYCTSTFLNRPANNLYKWFHVFEDELNHRGQIRMIVKRIRS